MDPVLEGSMKIHNLLLCREMATARREGRKTQTRRVAKIPEDMVKILGPCGNKLTGDLFLAGEDRDGNSIAVKCPIQPGDSIRWLTTWAYSDEWDDCKPSKLPSLEISKLTLWSYHDSDTKPEGFGRLRSGLFLPGHLRDRMPVDIVTAVRCERVNEISEEDAKAEGIIEIARSLFAHGRMNGFGIKGTTPEDAASTRINAFVSLWNRLHGPGAWERGDWVWVYEFKPNVK